MSRPVRVQLRRSKGWRMPANTVKVDRSTPWGNPFRVGQSVQVDPDGPVAVCFSDHEAVEAYRGFLDHPVGLRFRRSAMVALRGRNLACWCAPGKPCHADVLLEIVNSADLDAVCSVLANARLDLSTEAVCQAEMEIILKRDWCPFLFVDEHVRREVRLSAGDRIDFLLTNGLGIEVKIGGGRRAQFAGQLARYAAHDEVSALILATNTAVADVPAEINGKPVRVVSLGRGWL